MNEQNDKIEKYKIALDNVRYQGQLLWTIMGIFLIAHSVILQSILGDISYQNSFWGSLIGMLLSIMWIFIFHRNLDFYKLRFAQAKANEPSNWNFLNGDGERFSDGDTVHIGEKDYKIGFLGNIIRTEKFSYFIYLFLSVYLIIFIKDIVIMAKWWIC